MQAPDLKTRVFLYVLYQMRHTILKEEVCE